VVDHYSTTSDVMVRPVANHFSLNGSKKESMADQFRHFG
jgi:hypothetical protein